MQLPFKNKNVMLILGGALIIALGYVLMSTENFIDASMFSLSLYVSPILIIAGHVVVVWGILTRSGDNNNSSPINEDTTTKV